MGKSDYTFRYKVRNWPEYNRALVKRGQLTLWFNTEAVAAWRYPGPFEGRGRPKVYADAAIQCALVLNSVFHLNLRTCRWRITNNALKEGLLEKRKRVLDQPDRCYSFGPRCAVASWSTQSSSS